MMQVNNDLTFKVVDTVTKTDLLSLASVAWYFSIGYCSDGSLQ